MKFRAQAWRFSKGLWFREKMGFRAHSIGVDWGGFRV